MSPEELAKRCRPLLSTNWAARVERISRPFLIVHGDAPPGKQKAGADFHAGLVA